MFTNLQRNVVSYSKINSVHFNWYQIIALLTTWGHLKRKYDFIWRCKISTSTTPFNPRFFFRIYWYYSSVLNKLHFNRLHKRLFSCSMNNKSTQLNQYTLTIFTALTHSNTTVNEKLVSPFSPDECFYQIFHLFLQYHIEQTPKATSCYSLFSASLKITVACGI